jgi:hypothetical protein
MRRFVTLALVAGALVLPGQARAEDADVEVRVSGSEAGALMGCRTVDIAKTGRDIFRFVVYRFHQVKRWCWERPRITYRYVSTYVSDVDPNMEYEGVVGANGYYYLWCCGRAKSGHYSYRQGKFSNCILWFPCTRTEYPWVKIWAHGDGSYSYATGL